MTDICPACGDSMAVGRGAKRCASCAHAESLADVETTRHSSTGRAKLPVLCWCEQASVWVERTRLLDGRTESCGRTGCAPPLGLLEPA